MSTNRNIPGLATKKSIGWIKQCVCEQMGATLDDIHTNRRIGHITNARQVVMYFINKLLTGITHEGIVGEFGSVFTRPTVSYAIKATIGKCSDKEWMRMLDRIEAKIIKVEVKKFDILTDHLRDFSTEMVGVSSKVRALTEADTEERRQLGLLKVDLNNLSQAIQSKLNYFSSCEEQIYQ